MKWSKIVLAIALIICLMPMPYGYYMLIRYISTVIFGFMAYKYDKINKNELCITFIILAILFQPFVRIPLGRKIWNILDVAVATFLIILFLIEHYKNKKNESSQKKDYLTFCDIHGAGTITCNSCGIRTEVTVFMHGPYSCAIGRQCQSCGTFFTEYNESKIYHTFGPPTKDAVCPQCGTVNFRNKELYKFQDTPLFCPKCKSRNLKYYMKSIS